MPKYVLNIILLRNAAGDDDGTIIPSQNTKHLEIEGPTDQIKSVLEKLQNYNDRWQKMVAANNNTPDESSDHDVQSEPTSTSFFSWTSDQLAVESKIVLDWTLQLFRRINGVEKKKKTYDMGCANCKQLCVINWLGVRVLDSDRNKSHYFCTEIKEIP